MMRLPLGNSRSRDSRCPQRQDRERTQNKGPSALAKGLLSAEEFGAKKTELLKKLS